MSVESGVSEVIGAILLISIVAVAVGIIAVGLLSTPPPQEIPHINVLAVKNDSRVTLTLISGDDLNPDEFYLRLNNGVVLDPLKGDFDGHKSGEWPWSIGEQLYITSQPLPTSIDLIYRGGNGEDLIDTITVTTMVSGSGPDFVGPIPTPPVNFSEELSHGSVYFSRVRHGTSADVGGYINLTVNAPGAYLVLNPANPRVNLNNGDYLSIYFKPGSTPSVRIFSVGTKGWSIRGSGMGTSDMTVRINNGSDISGSDDLTDSWIPSYSYYNSTLYFDVGGSSDFTRLIINNTTRWDGLSTDHYRFVNIKPAWPQLFVFMYATTNGNDDNIFMVGAVDAIYNLSQSSSPYYTP